jgi:hypothetical protein
MGVVHGLVLSTFVTFLRETYGDADGVVPADAEYVPTETFADQEFTRLLNHAARALGTSRGELELEFGRFAGRHAFVQLYPEFYEGSGSTRTFLLDVEQKIHDLVRATVPHAAPPRLHVRPFGGDGVVVTYTSERELCQMAEGLVEGVAGYYGESVAIDHSQCMLRGDLACALFVVPSGGDKPVDTVTP